MPRVVVGRVPATAPKLCQKLRPYPPTLTDATDAEIQHFRRWPTPTDARKWLPKQVRYPSGRNSLLLPKQREVNGATAHDDADDVSARGTPSPYFLRTAHNGLCRCPITFLGCRRGPRHGPPTCRHRSPRPTVYAAELSLGHASLERAQRAEAAPALLWDGAAPRFTQPLIRSTGSPDFRRPGAVEAGQNVNHSAIEAVVHCIRKPV